MRGIDLVRALAGSVAEVSQAAAVLEAAGAEDPRSFGLGTSDRRLLETCRTVTGRDAMLVVTCAECGERSEVALSADGVPEPGPRCAWLCGGGVREPTLGDLERLPADPARATEELLRRCTVGAPARKPRPDDLDAVDDSLSGPLVAECAACGATARVPVDVEQLVLEELARHADGVERAVHLLAHAYHWPLSDIEALPDARRERLATLVEEQP